MGIALSMILAGVLPMPIVFLMRSFQCLKIDLDIHQGSIRRNETTASTKEMIDNDDDVSSTKLNILAIFTQHRNPINLSYICVYSKVSFKLYYVHTRTIPNPPFRHGFQIDVRIAF